jgi:tRNA pseudouridine38-40 synthase
MMHYKMVVAYDGTTYHGWQVQPDQITVAGLLESSFAQLFKQEVTLIGASRTDAGVHALGQVAHFSTDLAIMPAQLEYAWRTSLPSDILIRSIQRVDSDFHAQKNVCQKTYYYHIFAQRPLPFIARYGLYYRFPFDPQVLQQALDIFIGTHDFRSFCTGYERENTVRSIDAIALEYSKRYGLYRVIVRGPGFLRYMIRRIIGAALDVASSRYCLDDIRVALEAKNPQQPFATVPARGLLLRRIAYTDLRERGS